MELSKQVCTLDQAKRLKELGVKQKSLFYFYTNSALEADTGLKYHKETGSHNQIGKVVDAGAIRYHSAFTVAELGEMLPSETLTIRRGSEDSEYANWEWENEGSQTAFGPFATEAIARAEHLIHLLDIELVSPEDVNARLKN